MGCAHDHGSDVLQAYVCAATSEVRRHTDRATGIIVLRDEVDDDQAPAISMIANDAGMAAMALAICELATRAPRSTVCDNCAEAHDRMLQVVALLRGTPGRC